MDWNEALDVVESVPSRVRRLADPDADQSILVLQDVVRAETAQCLASNLSFVESPGFIECIEFALQIVSTMNRNGAA